MRNFKSLGKVLSKSEQKKIFGGEQPEVFQYEGVDRYEIPHYDSVCGWGKIKICN